MDEPNESGLPSERPADALRWTWEVCRREDAAYGRELRRLTSLERERRRGSVKEEPESRQSEEDTT